MEEEINLSETELGVKGKKAVASFCKALRNTPNVNIQSITLYGSAARRDYRHRKSDINLLTVLEQIDVPILKSVLKAVSRGRRKRICPFFITEENLRPSADVFPVKFLGMKESYHVLLGRDVLGDLEISREHLRLRCEQEINNLLLRLPHHFILGGGRRLREMMSTVIVGFLENLRVVLSLTHEGLLPREEVMSAAAMKFGVDDEVLRKVSALRNLDISLSGKEAEQLYDKFMAIAGRVAQIVDQIH